MARNERDGINKPPSKDEKTSTKRNEKGKGR